MIRVRLLTASAFLGFFIPLAAHAEQVTTWDFRAGHDAGQWEIGGFSQPKQNAEGVHLVAGPDGGRILRKADLPRRTEAIRFVFRHAKPGQVLLLWHPHNFSNADMVQLPLALQGDDPEIVQINLSAISQWDPQSDVIGIAMEPGTDITIEQVDLYTWNPWEKLQNAWLGFWELDHFRAYSINFLWGPLLVFNPIGRDLLYATQPPIGWSANRFFYAVLIVTALLLVVHWQISGRKHGARKLRIFGLIFLALWLLFDIRMGMETLHYASEDYTQYVSQPAGQKTFRNYQNFNDALEQSMPTLRKEPHFVFLGPPKTPFLSITRYFAYPSTPIFENEPVAGIKNWLIFRRPDVAVNQQNQLVLNGTAVTPPGDILKQFDDSSFLFRVR